MCYEQSQNYKRRLLVKIKAQKISKKCILETREFFRDFLDETDFPDPDRLGERGPRFKYPEWIIMFIAVLSVKLKIKSHVKIHKMASDYWDLISRDLDLKPISERQLRDRLKKICHHPVIPAFCIPLSQSISGAGPSLPAPQNGP
jgi:hypothetical protein